MRANSCGRGGLSCVALAAVAMLAALPATAAAQSWKPDRNIEIVVNTAPGSGPDTTGRSMQKLLGEHRLVEAPITVVNKPGGGGAIAYNYLNQHAGDGHFIAIVSKSFLTNHIAGRSPIGYADVTPLAILFEEYITVAVKADSPIRSGREIVERLKKDPGAVSFGVATSLGNSNHQSVAMPLKGAGIDLRKTKVVVFQSGGQAITALLGGHVDVVPGSVGLMKKHVEAGTLRLVAVAAPQRLAAPLAETPTWKEQGAEAVVSNWRGLAGPKGMTREQVAYWDNAIGAFTRTAAWKKELANRGWSDEYKNSAETRKVMEADYSELKAFLTHLELAK